MLLSVIVAGLVQATSVNRCLASVGVVSPNPDGALFSGCCVLAFLEFQPDAEDFAHID